METTEQPAPQTPKPVCPNCGRKMTRSGDFCPHCGQRRFDGRIRMRDLLSKFVFNLTHLDNKFVRMVWQLLLPGRVTAAYFQGKIKRYPHPMQFFFVVMFFFLLAFTRVFTHRDFHFQQQGEPAIIINPDSSDRDEVQFGDSDFYPALQRHAIAQEFRQAYDSLPASLRTPHTLAAFDSAVHHVDREPEAMFRTFRNLSDQAGPAYANLADSVPLSFLSRQVTIATADLVKYSPDEITARYGIRNWQDRTLVQQGIKSIKDPQGVLHAYLGSFTWTILALVTLMALVLRLLYWRRRHYYVEHFIFLLHRHSGTFLLLTLGLVIQKFYDLGPVWLLLFAWIWVTLLLAMRRFYGQSWFKTTVKWLVYSAVYTFGFLVLFVSSMVVVFLFF